MDEKKKPVYQFVELKEGEEVSPIRRTIAKTMEITENFALYDAMAYVAKMKKAVEDKKAEIDGLESMIKAYEEEIDLIEESLGVQNLEEEYQKEMIQKVKDEVIKQREEGGVESPYVEPTEEK